MELSVFPFLAFATHLALTLREEGRGRGQRWRGRGLSETATCRCNLSDHVAAADLLSPRSLARLLSRARLSFAHARLTHSP